MSRKIEQGTIIIIDIGRRTAADEKEGKSFFQKARECATCIIERKIISQGKNHLGVILVGAKTKNNLAEQCPGLYKRIEVLSELYTPTWNMIRNLPENPSNKTGDWFDALVVAADHFKGQLHTKYGSKKIVLMTNFLTPTSASQEHVLQMLDGFKDENFEVDVIGPDLYDENFKGDDIEIARQFVESTNGATANFEFAMQYLSFHRKKATNAVPWNVDLKIGPNISIPVAAYIRLKDEPVIKMWRKAVKDPNTGKASTTQGIVTSKVYMDSEKNIIDTDKIKGYHYGQSIIPLAEADKSMLYASGEKCLTLYGFTHKSNIGWQVLNGDSLYYVFGKKGDRKAQQAITCLAECLHQLGMVGIARRVYNNGNAPKMFALFPVFDTENYICLSMTAICFKEDIKYMAFPSTGLKKYACTDEQVNAFKDLIGAMDLTKAYDDSYDDTEAFPIAKTVSPFAQFLLDCISFRARNPDKDLPPPREEILNLFKVPPEVEQKAAKPLEKLKSLFNLNKVERKVSKKKINTDDVPIDNSGHIPDENLLDVPRVNLPQKVDLKIGTMDPIADYTQYKNNGKSLADLSQEMTKAIEDLMRCNLDGNYTKAFEVMKFYRQECVKSDPAFYNDWLQKFKVTLSNQKKNEVLDKIKELKVNFIVKAENSLSNYETEESHDESQLYQNDTIPNSNNTQITISTEIDDLFEDF